MSEVPNGMKLLESRMNEIIAKADRINEMTSHLEEMFVCELMIRVEALEDKATTTGSFKHRDSSTAFAARMEESIEGLNNAQQAIIQMVSKMSFTCFHLR